MLFIKDIFKRNYFLLILLFALSVLRFYNLGYSEYIPDETTVMTYLRDNGSFYSLSFLLDQRKGPLQFVTAFIPFVFTHNVYNELAFRIPFALANLLSVAFLYKFSENMFKNKTAAFFAAGLYGVNGFIVAFGRIVQYQSLNLLFSFTALYFYSKLNTSLRYAYLGTFFYCLSVLSHWDSLLILPLVINFLFSVYRKNRKTCARNIFFALIILAPFFIPFLISLKSNVSNISYFHTRIDPQSVKSIGVYIFNTKLYNPLYFWQIIGFFSLVSSLKIKKLILMYIWLSFNVLIFYIFIKSPGTHLYNLYLPLFFISGYGMYIVTTALNNKYYKLFSIFIMLIFITFLYYQSYLIFVDHVSEYPWRGITILNKPISAYTHRNLTNNIIGFPLNRGWTKTAAFLELFPPVEGVSYMTNENTDISGFYIKMKYGCDRVCYLIGVKTPYSFVNDYTFPQIKNKHTIQIIKKNNKTVARIYIFER